jgi:hypothetical protein
MSYHQQNVSKRTPYQEYQIREWWLDATHERPKTRHGRLDIAIAA